MAGRDEPGEEELRGPADTIVSRLLLATAREGVERVWPLWADGGEASGPFEPGRHVIAAWPTEVLSPEAATLEATGLETWLRRELESPAAGAPLRALALSYEAGRLFEPEALDGLRHREARVVLATYPSWLEADGPEGPWRWRGPRSGPLWVWWRGLNDPDPGLEPSTDLALVLEPEDSRASFETGLAAIFEGLARGDFYQVNLTRRLKASLPPLSGDALLRFVWGLYLQIRAAQPAPFGALFPLSGRGWLLSGSPECLLRWDRRARRAATWPIKGTAPRAPEEGDDGQVAATLAASPKDRAEHVMIVDLLRNDLGRIAAPGTVSVDGMMSPLTLRTIHHLVSEVRCEVAGGTDLPAILAAIFPGGSITGAPRIAAMEAIDRLEDSPRGFYCGSLGLIFGQEEATFSILIRSSVVEGEALRYGAGGGIVVDSDAEAEWLETEQKVEGLRRALRAGRR